MKFKYFMFVAIHNVKIGLFHWRLRKANFKNFYYEIIIGILGSKLVFLFINIFGDRVLVSFAKITWNSKHGLFSYLHVFIKCQKCDKVLESFELISINFPETFYEEMECNSGIL